jgi:hypothetical protein
MLVMLQKGLKSLPNKLRGFFDHFGHFFDHLAQATVSSFVQARLKLRYTAFIELNTRAVIQTMYADPEEYHRWKQFRVLAADATRLRLPDSPTTRSEFGTYRNQQPEGKGDYPASTTTVLYDVLNRIVLQAHMGRAEESELPQTVGLLQTGLEQGMLHPGNDLLLLDRYFAGYDLLGWLMRQHYDFVIRCPKQFYRSQIDAVFQQQYGTTRAGKTPKSVLLTLTRRAHPHSALVRDGLVSEALLPEEITVRCILFRLDSGEEELLVSSLLDRHQYPDGDFKAVYWRRWGIETFFATLKERLNIENFTGKSAEAVRQDFYSTVFVCGVESIMTESVHEQLQAASTGRQYDYTVNRNVSFGAIKDHVLELFFTESDPARLMDAMEETFRTYTLAKRPGRNHQRTPKDKKLNEKLHYRKREYKISY